MTDQQTNFELSGTLGGVGQIAASGWAKPSAAQRDFDVSAHAENVQLSRFSSYALRAVGMYIDSGTLEADVDAERQHCPCSLHDPATWFRGRSNRAEQSDLWG
jgi:hypothetical protein